MADTILIRTTCPSCNESQAIEVDKAGHLAWYQGELIQNALPDLTADKREALITGMCGPCFDSVFAEV